MCDASRAGKVSDSFLLKLTKGLTKVNEQIPQGLFHVVSLHIWRVQFYSHFGMWYLLFVSLLVPRLKLRQKSHSKILLHLHF